MRQRADTMVATEYIPAWHRSTAPPADLMPSRGVEPPRPLHYYQQWHGMTAPAPRRPVPSPLPAHAAYVQVGRTAPLPDPPPSSYLMSQLRDLTRRAEEQFASTSQPPRTQSADPYAYQSPSTRRQSSSRRRGGP
ncbi:hypothetical protein BV20DRAFT_939029 [Pilatotrama ljubarskyi]|nr:hypothetical protein BV20DRAFT_939029 [Pilatotrama ljubarskyi]